MLRGIPFLENRKVGRIYQIAISVFYRYELHIKDFGNCVRRFFYQLPILISDIGITNEVLEITKKNKTTQIYKQRRKCAQDFQQVSKNDYQIYKKTMFEDCPTIFLYVLKYFDNKYRVRGSIFGHLFVVLHMF